MGQFFYNFFIHILAGIYALASMLNAKAKLFVSGRKNIFKRLSASLNSQQSPVIWIHCASLGEFEQGRPIIEALRPAFPHHKILLTFFSPSGYENKKDYSQADFIFYLPWDTPANARLKIAVFSKY
jgi:3-deoxy-D-manno-octulosonic-acid transferase